MRNIKNFIDRNLPIIGANVQLEYNEDQNLFTTRGYTSLAGNIYFNGIRVSERISIITDVGIGYCQTFLNRLRIVSIVNPKIILADRRFHCYFYQEYKVKNEAKKLLNEYLIKKAKEENYHLDLNWLDNFINKLVEDTYNDQIENLKKIQGNKLLAGNQNLFLS